MKELYCFPYKYRIIGWILLFAGMVMAVFYLFFDFRFSMPVFAIYSSFFETKYLTVFQTNFADELTLLLLIGGFFILVFTRETTNDTLQESAKSKAIFKALYYNSILLMLSILFVFGQGFIGVLVLNIFSIFVLYLIFYRCDN